jgi:hypothetical protein
MKTLAVVASATGILIGALAVPSDADARGVTRLRGVGARDYARAPIYPATPPMYSVRPFAYWGPSTYSAGPPVYSAGTRAPRRYDNPGIPDFQDGSRG